jgi:hypothetical protein
VPLPGPVGAFFCSPQKNASARIPAGDAYGDMAQCGVMQPQRPRQIQKSAPHPSTYLLPSPPGGRKKVALAGQATSRNMGFATGGQLWRCALVCQANLLCGLAIRKQTWPRYLTSCARRACLTRGAPVARCGVMQPQRPRQIQKSAGLRIQHLSQQHRASTARGDACASQGPACRAWSLPHLTGDFRAVLIPRRLTCAFS